MNPESVLIELLGRVGAARGMVVLFSTQELGDWPIAAVAALKKQGLLTKASPARTTICPGCERECVMPVYILPDTPREPEAFIVCDKRSDINRVPVPVGSLEQWQASGAAIAGFLTRALGLRSPGSDGADTARWEVGMFKGVKHASHLVLSADGKLTLALAGHEIELADILTPARDGFIVDARALRSLADHPVAGGGDMESTGKRRERIAKRMEALRAKGVRAFLQTVAEEEGITKSRVQQLLKSKPESINAQKSSPARKGTISRKL